MKKIIQLLYILFAVAAFSACSDDNQGEIGRASCRERVSA